MNQKKPRKVAFSTLLLFLFAGCASLDRGCSSCNAENFGADYVIVQMDLEGRPFRCWALQNVSITNESQSDGIYWKDTASGNLVHISGHYNRVQVVGGNWNDAFQHIGLTKEACGVIRELTYDPAERKYVTPAKKTE